MMQIVPKWKVTVTIAAAEPVLLWISDHHVSNVLRQLAAIQFSSSGLDQITSIRIELSS